MPATISVRAFFSDAASFFFRYKKSRNRLHVLLVSYLFMFEYLAGYLTVLPVMVIRDLTFKGNDKGYFDYAEFPNGFLF